MPQSTVILKANTEELDAKLSKTMKEMGAHYDEYGRLINKEGEFIGGLSQARVKMGDWIDSMGRMRDANGNYTDGLTSTQRALRMYKDEIGNLYTAEGELVRAIEESNDAVESQGVTLQQNQQISSALQGSLGAFGGAVGSLSQVTALLGNTNGAVGESARKFAIATQAVQIFSGTASAIQGIKSAMLTLTIATNAQSAAQTVLNALSGNWVALAAGAIAAGGAVYALTNTVEKSTEAVTNQIPEVEALTAALKKCGLEMKSLSAEQAGFMRLTGSELDGINKATKALEDYDKKTEQALQRFQNYQKGHALQDEGFWKLRNEYEGLSAHRDDQKASVALEINKLMAKDLPTDEMAALKERAAYYAEVIESGTLSGDALVNAQKALENNLKKQDEIVQKENKAREDEAKRIEEEAKRSERLNAEALGYAEWLKADKAKIVAPTTQAELDAAIKKAGEDLGEGSELYKTAVQNLKKSFEETARKQEEEAKKEEEEKRKQAEEEAKRKREEAKQAFLSDSDISGLKSEDTRSAKQVMNDTINKINDALAQGLINEQQSNEMIKQAKDRYKDAVNQAAEAEKKAKEQRLNELGINGLRERLKTPLDKYDEQMKQVNQALKEGLITKKEANRFDELLLEDYYKAAGVQNQNMQQAQSGGQEKEMKANAPSAMTAGSADVYKTMVSNQNSFQNKIQRGVSEIATYMSTNSTNSTEILTALQNFASSIGVY